MASLIARMRESRGELSPKILRTDYSVQSEFLREATADTEMQLRLEDIGYIRLNAVGGKEANDLRPTDREAIVKRARLYFQQDALASRGVKIYTSYCIGRGLSIKSKDDTAQSLANQFWNDPRNQVVFSFQGQQKSSNKLLVEGEVFFVLFPPKSETDDPGGKKSGPTTVRRIVDPLEITDIITNPHDYEEIWYYRRTWTPKGGTQISSLYPDYRMRQLYPDEDYPQLIGTLPDGAEYDLCSAYALPADIDIHHHHFVKHVLYNSIGERGISFLAPVMGWTKAHKEFMEDRIALNRGWARFAWFRKVKGAPSQIRSFAGNQPNAGPTDLSRLPWNQPAGGIMTTNDAVNWQSVSTPSGGGSAITEANAIKLMACAAMGLPLHYLGDAGNGNRATATVMERPVQLTFQDYQEIWKEAYECMFAFDMYEQGYTYDEGAVEVDAPPILEEDSVALATAIVQLAQAMPELKTMPFYRRALESLNLDNTQDILPDVMSRAAKFEKLSLAAGVNPYGQHTFGTSTRTPTSPGRASGGEATNGDN